MHFKKIIFLIMILIFPCTSLKALECDKKYLIETIASLGKTEYIGCTDNYDEAKKLMREYDSTKRNVAVIYEDGVLVNARYAVVNFTGRSDLITIYNNENLSGTRYAYIHGDWGADGAFLDYNPVKKTIKVKISGLVGWTKATNADIIPLANLGEGTVLVSEDLNYECKNFNCKNTDLIVDLKNIYFENQLDLKIKDFYNKKNFKKKTNLNYDDYINDYSQVIFISEKDYQKLLSKDIYQSSIFVKDVKNIRKTTSSLEELGYKTLVVSDTLVSNEYMKIFKVIKFVAIIIVVIVLFFVAYFVIKIILKSRNVYFTTLRILGASKSVCKNILNIELINISNLTYFAFLILIILTKNNILNLEYLKELITYLEVKDYIVLYIILVTMSYILSLKFAKKLFKESAVKTYYEEV